MIAAPSRKGFTLVELLVVTGLLATLLGLMLVTLRPTAQSHVRELARRLQSALMQAQTRSLTTGKGVCLVLEPSAASAVSCRGAYFADPQPAASTQMQAPTGFTLQQILTTGTPNLFYSGSTNAAFLPPTNANLSDLESGYRVRFLTGSTYGPWYNFSFSNTSETVALALLTSSSSTLDPATNIWPATVGNQVPCEVARYPQRTQDALTAPKLASIDLRYSGMGDSPPPSSFTASETAPPIYWYASFQPKDTTSLDSICLEFNRIGALATLCRVTPPTAKSWAGAINANYKIYFLAATNEDIAKNNSLNSADSMWIAIDPQTGAVSIGKNNPSGAATIRDYRSPVR
jgi:prepilin-type N-terminal cleavage/methylation domain-containing protein